MVTTTFYADVAIFDMDGTLTDSISAVEAAWSKVATELGLVPSHVIAATHGRRAEDNLASLKPGLTPGSNEMRDEVDRFERSILFFADAFGVYGPGTGSGFGRVDDLVDVHLTPVSVASYPDSGATTPGLMTTTMPVDASGPPSRDPLPDLDLALDPPIPFLPRVQSPSFSDRLRNLLSAAAVAARLGPSNADAIDDDVVDALLPIDPLDEKLQQQQKPQEIKKQKIVDLEPWQIEASQVDRSIRILPGVKQLIDSIPSGRFAIATSGARTYAYGCLSRINLLPLLPPDFATSPPPPFPIITADHPDLRRGKPAPDPFLLAARQLGVPLLSSSDNSTFASSTNAIATTCTPYYRCVIFEDSPSGIEAGLRCGPEAVVVGVCTSHERAVVQRCCRGGGGGGGRGRLVVVRDLECVRCEVVGLSEGREVLKFTVVDGEA